MSKIFYHGLTESRPDGDLIGVMESGDAMMRNSAQCSRIKELKFDGQRLGKPLPVHVQIGSRSSTFHKRQYLELSEMDDAGCVAVRMDDTMFGFRMETAALLSISGYTFWWQPSGDRIICGEPVSVVVPPVIKTVPLSPPIVVTTSDENDIEGDAFACGATVFTTADIILTWDSIDNAVSYIITVTDDLVCGGSIELQLIKPSSTLTYTISSGVLGVGNHSAKVTAVGDGINDSNRDSDCCAFAIDNVVPLSCDSPVDLSAVYPTLYAALTPVTAGLTSDGGLPTGTDGADSISNITCAGTAPFASASQPDWNRSFPYGTTGLGTNELCSWGIDGPSDTVQKWGASLVTFGGGSTPHRISLFVLTRDGGSPATTAWMFSAHIVGPTLYGAKYAWYVKYAGLSPFGTYNAVCANTVPTTQVISASA